MSRRRPADVVRRLGRISLEVIIKDNRCKIARRTAVINQLQNIERKPINTVNSRDLVRLLTFLFKLFLPGAIG